MWLIYAVIAMVSPAALFLTRNWLRRRPAAAAENAPPANA
jgi:hypothetical protein